MRCDAMLSDGPHRPRPRSRCTVRGYYKWSRERQQEEISDDIRRGGEGIADGGGVKKLEVTKAVTKDEATAGGGDRVTLSRSAGDYFDVRIEE